MPVDGAPLSGATEKFVGVESPPVLEAVTENVPAVEGAAAQL
jgi:hypothetical protein